MGRRFLVGIGRILVSLIFLVVGIASIYYWEIYQREFLGILANWEIYSTSNELISLLVTRINDSANIFLILGVVLQIIGGISLFFGFRVRIGAFLLLLYLIPANIIYHHFWFLQGDLFVQSFNLFLQNLAIIGALFLILSIGNGKNRLFNRERKKPVIVDEFDEEN